MKLVQQVEAAECGLACVAIVLQCHGSHVDLPTLRRTHAVSTRGMTMRELIDVASSYGLVGRGIRCELDELEHLKCPAVLHWGMNHYVVLMRCKAGKLRIQDPALGMVHMSLAQASRFFTGVAVEMSTAPDFKRRREKSPLSVWSWFRFDRATHGSLAQILILSLLLQLYVVASPFYLQLAIDQAALKGDAHLLNALALGFGLFAVFNVGAEALRGVVTTKINGILNWDMTLRLFRHMIRLPLPWFQRRRLADVLSRFDSVTPLRDTITGGLISTVVDGVLALATLVMMFVFAPQLAWVVVLGQILYVAIRLGALPLSIRLGMEVLAAKIEESGKRLETLRAIQTLKVLGAENQREADWANKLANVIKREQTQSLANLAFSLSHQLVDGVVYVVLIFLGARSIIAGNMSVGLMYAFLSYQHQFSSRASTLFDQLMHFRLMDIYSHRLADIVLTPRENGIDDVGLSQPELQGRIELDNLSFAYAQNDTPIFRNISLTIEPGEFVAIAGPSGCGKTSLLKVMCGLYPATYGEVRIDGRPLMAWGPRAIRRALGVVMQDDELLTGTIAENVACFDDRIDMDRVWECLRMAQLAEDVLKMPMRTDSLVGDIGASLSGGQKQRLQLARALYRRPRLLVLDEASSHLDPERERLINQALRSLKITRIVVAHRAETLAAADRIITLANGGIVSDDRILHTSTGKGSSTMHVHI